VKVGGGSGAAEIVYVQDGSKTAPGHGYFEIEVPEVF